jgi:hypothetical protein
MRHHLLGVDLRAHEDEHGDFRAEELAEARAHVFGATNATSGTSAT